MTAKVLPGPGFPPFIVCKSFSALIYSSSSVPSVPSPRVGHILPSPTQDLPLGLWDMVPGVQSRIPKPTSLTSLCPEILIPSATTRQDLLGYPCFGATAPGEAQMVCGAEGALVGHGSDTTGSPISPCGHPMEVCGSELDPTSTLPSWLPVQLLCF